MIVDPIRSLVDFSFYKEARKHSGIRCAGYILYVGLLFSIFVASLVYVKARPIILGAGEWLANSMPSISIAEGKATSDPPALVIVHPPKDDKLGILIDTGRTEPLTLEEMGSKSLIIAVTRDAVYIAEADRGRLERRAFSEIKLAKPLTIDANFYRRGAQLTLRALYVFLMPMFWILFVFWKLASALVYSLAGFLINEATEAGLDFVSIYKMAIYAQTPWIVLQAVMLPLRRGFPWPVQLLMGLIVTSVFLWKAISQARETAA